MKFFKHFTDAHRGSSLKILHKKCGMAGIGRYWTLVELCAEKMEKERSEEYNESHTNFQFEKSYLASSLGYANLKQASSYLQALAELGLCSVSDTGELWSCSMPKLLECIDRDSKRARPGRASDAPKKKNKKKNKKEEVEEETTSAANDAPTPSPKKKAEIIIIGSAQDMVNTFSEKFLTSLRKTYGDEFVAREIPQMALKIIATEEFKTTYQEYARSWMKYAAKNAEADQAQLQRTKNINNVMLMVENA